MTPFARIRRQAKRAAQQAEIEATKADWQIPITHATELAPGERIDATDYPPIAMVATVAIADGAGVVWPVIHGAGGDTRQT